MSFCSKMSIGYPKLLFIEMVYVFIGVSSILPTVSENVQAVSMTEEKNFVRVHKCCETYELMVDGHCKHSNETDTGVWSPIFTGEDGRSNVQHPGFKLIIGLPECGARQHWPIYHYSTSLDRLVLLHNGVLRHYVAHHKDTAVTHENNLLQEHQDENGDTHHHFDYIPGTYCLDNAVLTQDKLEAQFALVCAPVINIDTSNTDYIMCRIVDPVCHGVAIACYLTIAVIYFIVPQLRDLVGNILTSIAICFIISQSADLVRIFTEFTSHVSFLVADIVMYVSLMAAFFWLNSLGYYIWKTFRSRNVFLRVTDGRKYCYYSCYAWGSTIAMSSLALFAHFMLDTTSSKNITVFTTQKTIGWLGKAVFFTPVAFTVLINLFFYLATGHAINQMSTYGRIHHKMKYSFELFVKLFLVMLIAWLFLLISWLGYKEVIYIHIVTNILQSLLILYICILGQRRVMFLLCQSCCCCQASETVDGVEWGEEMSSMNTSHY